MTKNICITTFEYPPLVGGVGQSVYRIANLMSKGDYNVDVAFFRKRGLNIDNEMSRNSLIKTYRQNNINVHEIFPLLKNGENSSPEFLLEAGTQLKFLQKKYGYDLFHSFYLSESGFLTTLVARELNRPVVCSIRGSDIRRDIYQRANSHIIWTLENANHLTFVSGELLNLANILVRGVEKKSTVIFNSIDPDDFLGLPVPTIPLAKEKPIIGALGQFRHKKGIEFLLDACELLDGLDFSLLLIGDFKENEKEYWLKELARTKISDRVILTGILPRNEALAYLNLVDIFVLPSTIEGCPNVLLEAMMASKPIIASKVGAICEILQDKVDALLVDPGYPEEIAKALEIILSDSQLAKYLATNSKNKAINNFSPTIEFRQWDNCYKELLKTHYQ